MNVNPYAAPPENVEPESAIAGQAAPEHRSFRLTQGYEHDFGTLREAFWFAIMQQVALLVLSSMMLDFGYCFRAVVIGGIAFWCFVAIFWIRRRRHPTPVDILLLKYGIWPTTFAVPFADSLLGHG